MNPVPVDLSLLGGAASDAPDGAALERLRAGLLRVYPRMLHAASGFTGPLAEHRLYAEICAAAVEEGGLALAWVGQLDRATGQVEVIAAHGATGYLSGLEVTMREGDPTSKGPTAVALRERRTVVCNDFWAPEMHPWRSRAAEHGFSSSASIPLLDRGEAYAVLSLYAPEVNFFSPAVLLLVEQLAASGALIRRVSADQTSRFRLALDGSGLTAFTMDSELRYTWIENPIFGYRSEQMLGRRDADLLPPDGAAQVSELKRRVLDRDAPVSGEVRLGAHWYWLTARPLHDAAARVIGLAGQMTDISERKAAELELGRLAAAADHGMDAVVSLDRELRIRRFNRGAERLFGYKAHEVLGRRFEDSDDSIPGSGPSPTREAIAHILAGGAAVSLETPRTRKDGTRFEVLVTMVPWRVGGELVGVTSVTVDISERKRAERDRELAIADLQDAQRMTKLGSWTRNRRTGEVTWSPQMYRILGRDPADGEPTDAELARYVHPDDRQRVDEAITAALAGEENFDIEHRIFTVDGRERMVHTVARRDRRRPGALIGTVQDVTERSEAQCALAESEARYRRILDTTLEGVWILDAADVTTFANPALAEMLALAPEAIIGRPIDDFIDPSTREAVAESGGLGGQSELLLHNAAGEPVWALVSANPMYEPDGSYAGTLVMVTNISDRKAMEERLRHLAEHDPLTGIYNRRRLIEELDQQLRSALRTRRGGAVLLIDLDHLKVINDTYGHGAGDAALRRVVDALRARVRRSDVLARLGGDEFALVLPDLGGAEANSIAREIRDRLARDEGALPISVSVGIVEFTGEERLSADEILACGDTALYEAKERGGNEICVYSGQAAGALQWVQRIRAALAGEGFELYGQPIVDLRTGATAKHELLLRMRAADGTVIAPGAFIPTAERFGLIGELDEWVTGRGLEVARAGTSVTINLSGHSVGQEPILALCRHAVERGLDPATVTFEITETAAMSNLTIAREFVGSLTELGYAVALDDFGTGFGSFIHLKHIPARFLKIDMEFVRGLTSSETDQHVVRSIVGIARSLGQQTIAEGVEDATTLELLREFGVDFAQGYAIGRPAPLSPDA